MPQPSEEKKPNPYTEQEALEEAEKMKDYVETRMGSNYQDAERDIENQKARKKVDEEKEKREMVIQVLEEENIPLSVVENVGFNEDRRYQTRIHVVANQCIGEPNKSLYIMNIISESGDLLMREERVTEEEILQIYRNYIREIKSGDIRLEFAGYQDRGIMRPGFRHGDIRVPQYKLYRGRKGLIP